jgi:hypothetical protein
MSLLRPNRSPHARTLSPRRQPRLPSAPLAPPAPSAPRLQGGTLGFYQANPVTQVITHVIYSARHERNRGRPRVWALFIRMSRRRILHSPGPLLPVLPLGPPDRSGGMRSCAFLCATTRYKDIGSMTQYSTGTPGVVASLLAPFFPGAWIRYFREHFFAQFFRIRARRRVEAATPWP